MLHRKNWAGMALFAAVACAGLAKADDLSTTPKYLDEAPARKPLMGLFDKAGMAKTLDSAGINIYGDVEGSYTYSFSSPPDGIISGRSFDVEHSNPALNAVDLSIERTVDVSKKVFDVGFKVEQLYGWDGRFTHSNGMTIYATDKTGSVGASPRNQYDVIQAYVDLAVPVGTGMDVRIGKFNTLLGYEVTTYPAANTFYSHSFLFVQLPFTHTGVLVSYPKLTDSMGAQFGIVRGWDQALEDNNGELSYTGQLSYTKDKYTGYFNFMTGSERATTSGWRTVFDYIGSYNYSDQLTISANADFGMEAQANPTNGKTAYWYGVACYGVYKLNDMFSPAVRLEWFNDENGGAPYTITGASNTYYEATIGVSIKPMPTHAIMSNLVIRPELRFDLADKPAFDGGTDRYQTTVGVDAVFSF